MMCAVQTSLLFVLGVFLSPIICPLDKFFIHLEKYTDYIYKIHPLVIFEDQQEGRKLLPQNELNEKGEMKLKKIQRIILHCSGLNNMIAMGEDDKINIFVKKAMVKSWNKTHTFPNGIFDKNVIENTTCLSPLFVDNEWNKTKCEYGNGLWIRIGFKINEDYQKLYDICFDSTENMMPLYTKHELLGTKLLFPENVTKLAKFPMTCLSGSMFPMRHLDWVYVPINQEKLLKSIFGRKRKQWLMVLSDSKRRLLIPAPLTPPGDFYYTPVKTASYMHGNVVPVFTSIYHNNWYAVEIIGRVLALQTTTKSLTITTGVYGLLKLMDDDKREKMIYLDVETKNSVRKQHRPVPKFLYKIYYCSYSETGIAFVTLNNPYLVAINYDDFPCKNIKRKFIDFEFLRIDIPSGLTIYCDIKDLMETVKDIPKMNLSDKILKFDKKDKKFLLDQLQNPREMVHTEDELDY